MVLQVKCDEQHCLYQRTLLKDLKREQNECCFMNIAQGSRRKPLLFNFVERFGLWRLFRDNILEE
jgi:hypothetical protein